MPSSYAREETGETRSRKGAETANRKGKSEDCILTFALLRLPAVVTTGLY